MNQETQKLTRKERERLFKRQEIVNAARVVFAARGFDAATLDEIAERAEFGKGTLYNYFQNKEELFESVIADIFDEFVGIAVATCTNPAHSFKDSYIDFARQLLDHLFKNMGMYNLLMREMHRMDRHSHLATLFPNLLMIIEEPLQRAVKAGVIAELPTTQMGFLYVTSIFSLFNSSLHLQKGFVCVDGVPQLTLGEDEIEASIAHCIRMIDIAFFNGVLNHRPGPEHSTV